MRSWADEQASNFWKPFISLDALSSCPGTIKDGTARRNFSVARSGEACVQVVSVKTSRRYRLICFARPCSIDAPNSTLKVIISEQAAREPIVFDMAKCKSLAASSDEMDVYIKLTTGRVVPLKVGPSTTVSKLCQELRGHETAIAPSRLALKYQGKLLDKSKTVGEYGVTKETVLRVEVLPSRTLNIFIKMANGKVVPLTIENTSTVSQLKDMINDKEDIPTNRQQLSVGDRKLSSGLASLEEAGIDNEAVVQLKVREPDAACISAAAATAATEMDESEKEVSVCDMSAARGKGSHSFGVWMEDWLGARLLDLLLLLLFIGDRET